MLNVSSTTSICFVIQIIRAIYRIYFNYFFNLTLLFSIIIVAISYQVLAKICCVHTSSLDFPRWQLHSYWGMFCMVLNIYILAASYIGMSVETVHLCTPTLTLTLLLGLGWNVSIKPKTKTLWNQDFHATDQNWPHQMMLFSLPW